MTNFKDMVGTPTGSGQDMLGKFLYFSLPSVLVEKDALTELCDSMGMPYAGAKRLSVSDVKIRPGSGNV